MQVVVTLGVMHLLDASNSDSYYRQVIVSSDPHAHEMFYIDNGHIKQNSTKKGVWVKIHGVYDVTDKTLESAIALVVANKYPQLQSDLIKRDMPIGKLDGEPMWDRELLAKFGFTA